MEHHEIKLLSNSTFSNFVTKKWIEVNNFSGGQYSVDKKIRFKTPIQRSDLCDYSDVFVVVKGRIIPLDLGKTYYKMTVSEKIKTIDNKIEQNKARQNLDR